MLEKKKLLQKKTIVPKVKKHAAVRRRRLKGVTERPQKVKKSHSGPGWLGDDRKYMKIHVLFCGI